MTSKETAVEILDSMTLREKVGQLFVIKPESLDPSYGIDDVHKYCSRSVSYVNNAMRSTFSEYPAGGIILFGWHLRTPKQTKAFVKELHALKIYSEIPTYLYVDEEGGKVARLAQNPKFNLPQYQDMKSVGETGDEKNAYEAGCTIGAYLNEYGFDVDFAPVADVDTNPDNPIIGRRSFSSDPETAAKMAAAFNKGLNSKNIKGCLKHFPGHGDTHTDSHKGYAETTKTWDELKNCEMIPFAAGINSGVKYIMTAHITAPKVDSNNVPSTLSSVILTQKLRGELGYNGIIITDAMEMGAIIKEYNPQEAALMALEAGVDILLIPYDYRKTFDAVMTAVESGRISEERINESVLRILKVKLGE